MLLILNLKNDYSTFYWPHSIYSHCSSPPSSSPSTFSFPTITSLIPPFSPSLSWTCYLICFPRTSEFANTQLVRLITLWSMISWSHVLHPERKQALFLSSTLPSTRSPLASHESRMPESPRVILNKGVWHVTFLNVHFILGRVNEVFFKFISPAPKNW